MHKSFHTLWRRALLPLALMMLGLLGSMAARADAVGTYITPGSEPLTLNTNCGDPGVGILPYDDTKWFKGYLADKSQTVDAKYNPQYGTAAVGADGKWFLCQPWIKPGQPPSTPQPDNTPCGGGLGEQATWKGSTGDVCRGDHPFAGALSGKTEVFRSAELGKYGNATFKCVAGKMVLQEGSDCFKLKECAGSITARWGTGNNCSATATGYFPAGTVIPLTSDKNGWKGRASVWCNPVTIELEWNATGGAECAQK